MQTFLPYPNFKKCAEILDWQRLGKQRVEGMQAINCIEKSNRWINHPVVKMWYDYKTTLMLYVNEMIFEWKKRGYNNNMIIYPVSYDNDFIKPIWLEDERLHSSHRANLLKKRPDYYCQYGWCEDPIQEYWWPYRKCNKEWVCHM